MPEDAFDSQTHTPRAYIDWVKRASLQKDEYAKFFMLFIAAVISQESNVNDYDKLNLLGKSVEKIYKKTRPQELLLKNIDSAIHDMINYIQEKRGGKQIRNLSPRSSKAASSNTNFNESDTRIPDALTSILIVRNNLFHGDKQAYNQNDIEIVHNCNAILDASLALFEFKHQ